MIPNIILEQKMEKLGYAVATFFIAAIPDYQGELLRYFFSIAAAVSSFLIIDIIKKHQAKRKLLKQKKNETNGKL